VADSNSFRAAVVENMPVGVYAQRKVTGAG
jgi:hypothetical protein